MLPDRNIKKKKKKRKKQKAIRTNFVRALGNSEMFTVSKRNAQLRKSHLQTGKKILWKCEAVPSTKKTTKNRSTPSIEGITTRPAL